MTEDEFLKKKQSLERLLILFQKQVKYKNAFTMINNCVKEKLNNLTVYKEMEDYH
jgi:hypothetical protein